MTKDEILEGVEKELNVIIDEYKDEIIASSDDSPRSLSELPEELQERINSLWDDAIDELAIAVNEEVNSELEEADSAVDKELSDLHKGVGGYFILGVIQRAFHRIHGTNIALQVDEGDRDKEVGRAVEISKSDAKGISEGELLFAAAMFTQREYLSRGVKNYIWRTVGDNRVRPAHRSNEGRVFSWTDAPSTGHPGTAHRCRCSATPTEEEKQKVNMKNIKIKAMSGGKVSFDILGGIGDDWGVNTTDWQLIEFSGITQDTPEIHARINSCGGDLMQGIAIYNYLKNHPAKVTTEIIGEASSAASIIYLAGSERLYPEVGATAGTHYPFPDACFCDMNHEEFQAISDELKVYSDMVVNIYKMHLTIDEDEIRALLSASTILDAAKAMEIGFATRLITAKIEGSPSNLEMSFIESDTKLINSVKESNTMSKTQKDHEQRVVELEDILAAKTSEFTKLKAKFELAEQSVTDLKDDILAATELADELEAKLKNSFNEGVEVGKKDAVSMIDIKAKAKTLGVEAEGSTPDALMRSVILAKGVKSTESLNNDAIESIYAYVTREMEDAQAGDIYKDAVGSTDTGDKVANPYAKAKTRFKSNRGGK